MTIQFGSSENNSLSITHHFAMYCEYEAIIYALPPQVAITGPLKPKVFRRFTAWLLFAYSTSLVAHMDLATNALFLAEVLATEGCGAMASIENAWEDVFSKSFFLGSWPTLYRRLRASFWNSGWIFREVLKTLFRFVLFMWFESILQLELRGSALELGKAVSKRWRRNFLTLCKTLWSQVRACLGVHVDERIADFFLYDDPRANIKSHIVMPIFVILVICFALVLLHALVKTVMVSFYCDCKWNLRLDPFDGCVPPQSRNGTCFVAREAWMTQSHHTNL